MKKIGIFGGTVDPFTPGHASVIENAFKSLGLDEVIIVPTTVNYYRPDKRYLFTFDEKVRIIQDFITGLNRKISIDTIEKDKDESWRTIDLVKYFSNKFPNDKIYLIIGEDSYNDFKNWSQWKDILNYVELAVANRSSKVDDVSWKSDVPAIPINMGDKFEDCSATRVRNKLIEELIDMYLSDKEWYAQ